ESSAGTWSRPLANHRARVATTVALVVSGKRDPDPSSDQGGYVWPPHAAERNPPAAVRGTGSRYDRAPSATPRPSTEPRDRPPHEAADHPTRPPTTPRR